MLNWKLLVAPLLALALTTTAWAAELKLPDKVTGQPGAFIEVTATTDGAEVRWVAIDAGLNVFPSKLLKDSKTAVVVAMKAGKYRLLGYTSDAKGPSDPALCIVEVGDTPPGPTPPGPVPPPPGPNPPPPGPDADLLKALTTAFNKDDDSDKGALKAKLTAIYRTAATTTVSDTGLATVKDIDAVIRKTSQDAIGVLPLRNLRDAIGGWLRNKLPTKLDTPADDALRQKLKSAYISLADALEGVK